MPEQTITITQDELDALIEKRIARVRKEYEDDGQQSWRSHARRWEDRCKEARAFVTNLEADRDAWRSRAKFNIAQIQLLEKLNTKILDRLERHAA